MSLLPDKPRRGQAPTIVAMQVPANGDANTTRVYVFDREDNSDRKIELDSNMAVEKITTRLEIIHCLCSMLPIFSFGIMLGWPSPTYPNLLDPIYTAYPFDPVGNFSIPSDPDAPLRGPFMITMIQSPLIAGLLMIGVTVIAPFSSHAYTIYSIKHGLLIALLAMILGWITLWQAKNVFHLLVSRFLIGVGNGFAVGQVKVYIQHTSLPLGWKGRMLKMINIVMLSGAICAYMMGIWLDFDGFAVAALVITVVFYLLLLFIPLGNLGDSKVEYVGRQQEQNGNQPHLGVWPLFRTPNVRKSTWLLIALVFVQQFVGAPATIVYSQVLLLNLGLPTYMVPYCALVYILVYVMAYLVGTFYFCTLSYTKKRCILTLSTVCTILALVLNIVIICYELRDSHTYIPLVGMCVYIFVYGLGLGTIPNSFVEHLFEPQWRRPAGELQLMCFSMFALIITKLLQVFFGEFALEYLYVLFLSVGLAGLAFIVCCLPKKPLHY